MFGRFRSPAGQAVAVPDDQVVGIQLELPEAIVQAEQMRELAVEKPSALLCYEREPAQCHRSLLLGAVASDADVTHLFP